MRRHVILLALAALTAALVAGCGGGGSSTGDATAASGGTSSSSSSSSSAAAVTAAEPTTSGGSQTPGAGQETGKAVAAKVRTTDPVTEGSAAAEIEPPETPLLQDNDEVSPTGAKAVKPCKLVTRKEATAILGKGTTVAERPQGPTCVYSNAGRTVTLAVEVNSVKRLRQEARKATKVEVDGRTGWCVKYQTTTVIVGISEGRILRADGPCQAGTRFASKALPRL